MCQHAQVQVRLQAGPRGPQRRRAEGALGREGREDPRVQPLRRPRGLEADGGDRQVRRRPEAGAAGLPVPLPATPGLGRGEGAPLCPAIQVRIELDKNLSRNIITC